MKNQSSYKKKGKEGRSFFLQLAKTNIKSRKGRRRNCTARVTQKREQEGSNSGYKLYSWFNQF